jgi:hypothetical protein
MAAETHRAIGKEYPLTLNEARQNRHIAGTSDFDPARSALTEDPVKLIELYAGKGSLIFSESGVWTRRERFTHTGVIGVYRNMTGYEADTTKGIIHYSKNGAHIVPAREE